MKYILIILLISLLSFGCSSETNTNTNTNTNINTNKVADVKATEAIKHNPYTHSYDNELPLQKERRLTLDAIEKSDDIKETKDLYKVSVNRQDGYQLIKIDQTAMEFCLLRVAMKKEYLFWLENLLMELHWVIYRYLKIIEYYMKVS